MRSVLFFLSLLLSSVICLAQLPIDGAYQRALTSKTRDLSGFPGENYWQNTANYDIKVSFDPSTRLLTGSIEVEYFNQSPVALNELWFKLYPNLYKKGASVKSKINNRDLGEGVRISSFYIDNQIKDTAQLIIDGTNMHTSIPTLASGKSIKLRINYHYILNKGSHIRTGEVSDGAYFMAYFFPRIAVFDDIDGWNKIPYSGDEEFYNDFCNFKVAITVPRGYAVWATGDLKKPHTVLQKNVARKLKLAEASDQTINVIDSVDLAQNRVTVNKPWNTFVYAAKNVVDFAFATSNHYLWKSSSLVVDSNTKRRTRVDAVFNPKHKDYAEVVDFARQTVSAMSYRFPKWPFPYNHETVFDGLDQMEYPMMANDNPTANREDAITLTNHEIFHTLFPFYMGTNETKHGWMDEGWATLGEWLISPMIDTNYIDDYGVAPTGSLSGLKDDSPIVTLTTDLKGSGRFTNLYPKPAFGYLFVKDYLGEELFTKALHHYIKTWNGKHPTPLDFFNSMNTGAGQNLDWFWKPWFFEVGVLDLAIKDVKKDGDFYKIVVENKSQMPMPVNLILTAADGSKIHSDYTISIWKDKNSQFIAEVNSPKKIVKVELKASHVPDKNRKDNVFHLN